MNLQFWKKALFCCCLLAITACSDEETVNPLAPTEIPEQPAELAEKLAQYNSDIAALQLMVDGEVEVVDYTLDCMRHSFRNVWDMYRLGWKP